MTENRTPEANAAILSTWLKALLLLRTVSLVVWLMDYLPLELTWLPWVDMALSALSIVYLFQLGRANRRYGKSAICRIPFLCYTLYTLASAYFPPSYMIALSNLKYGRPIFETVMLVLTVVSILAFYQEYHAHADVIRTLDPKLSRNWHMLFNYTLIGVILVSATSLVLALLIAKGSEGVYIPISAISANLTAGSIKFVLQIFYLIYLHKTVRLLQQ